MASTLDPSTIQYPLPSEVKAPQSGRMPFSLNSQVKYLSVYSRDIFVSFQEEIHDKPYIDCAHDIIMDTCHILAANLDDQHPTKLYKLGHMRTALS
jgi:hypothetical protein